MMRSLYAYHELSIDNSYLKEYKEKLGEERFNHVYNSFSKFLYKNIRVVENVGQDCEGLTYNSLKLIGR